MTKAAEEYFPLNDMVGNVYRCMVNHDFYIDEPTIFTRGRVGVLVKAEHSVYGKNIVDLHFLSEGVLKKYFLSLVSAQPGLYKKYSSLSDVFHDSFELLS